MSPEQRHGLTISALDLSSRWRSKTVTTNASKLTPHEEWELVIEVAAESPIRLVQALYTESSVSWGLVGGRSTHSIEVRMRFSPMSWRTSDDVQIGIGGLRVTVTDRALMLNPSKLVSVLLPETAQTGLLVPVCEIPAHRVRTAILPVVTQDTGTRRLGKWRILPKFVDDLPPELLQVISGKQSGMTPIEAGHEDDGYQ